MLHDKGIRGKKTRILYIYIYSQIYYNKKNIYDNKVLISDTGHVVIAGIINNFLHYLVYICLAISKYPNWSWSFTCWGDLNLYSSRLCKLLAEFMIFSGLTPTKVHIQSCQGGKANFLRTQVTPNLL